MNAVPDPLLGDNGLTPRQKAHLGYKMMAEQSQRSEWPSVQRWLALNDLFFLLVYVLNRTDADKDWIFARCREVQASPNGHIDLWARFHYKSTIGTFALTIQDILKDPELTIGIFSRSRPMAKAFLKQIKTEFENNQVLKDLFPDILWRDPMKEAPTWSLDDGLIVKRKGNPKEATVEAWGLIDGQPTGKHFKRCIYDDVIDKDAVTTAEMIETVTNAWELSLPLIDPNGGIRRYYGTFYHHRDTYKIMIERGHAKPRIHPCTVNGEEDGEPVLFSKEFLRELRVSGMSAYTYSCQMLLDPSKGVDRRFLVEWLRWWNRESIKGLNIYILVDAANAKKKRSDYTAMWVIGLGRDKNYYIIDGVRDRLDLGERTNTLFKLVEDYAPIKIGYEQYGLMADIAHIKSVQERDNFHFEIQQLGGNVGKTDRVEWLIPLFKQNRVYLPYRLMYTTAAKEKVDLVAQFVNQEYVQWPVPSHDDMLDCMSRIVDPDFKTQWPTMVAAGTRVMTALPETAETRYDEMRHR